MAGNPLTSDSEVKTYVEDVENFLEALKAEPLAIYSPELKFFRDYVQSLGGSFPQPPAAKAAPAPAPAPAQDEKKTEAEVVDEDEDMEEDVEEEEEEEEDDPDVVAADSEPFPKMPDLDVEPNWDLAGDKKMAAADAMSAGNFTKAIELLTEALCAQPSALTFAKRADCLLQENPPRPVAAIRDCDAALGINPDSAKSIKMRGKANALLGNWAAAARDLDKGLSMDFDETSKALRTKIAPKFAKIKAREDKARIAAQKKIEKERATKIKNAREAMARAKQEQEEREAAEKAQQGGMPGGMGGMPGGMGGMGGGMGGMPPGLMQAIMSDPELMMAMQSPKIQQAMAAMQSNPASLPELLKDPEVAAVFQKIQKLTGAGGGMGGGMGGMPGGMGGMPGGMGGMGGMPGGMGGFPGGMPGGNGMRDPEVD